MRTIQAVNEERITDTLLCKRCLNEDGECSEMEITANEEVDYFYECERCGSNDIKDYTMAIPAQKSVIRQVKFTVFLTGENEIRVINRF